MAHRISNFVVLVLGTLFFLSLVGVGTLTAQTAGDFLPNENIFDTLLVDLKVNGSDGPVSIAVGERIIISWESDGAKRCRGNWSKKDLPLNGKISGKLSRSLATSITVRIACIDEDGNRKDDTVILNITGSTSITPPPPPADQPIILSSCGEITKSGRYVLQQDVVGNPSETCFSIHDTNNVKIDCKKHLVRSALAFWFTKVKDYSLENCAIEGFDHNNLVLKVVESGSGVIQHNSFGKLFSIIDVQQSDELTFADNKVFGIYQQYYSTKSVIERNQFELPLINGAPPFVAGLINSEKGSDNRIRLNITDGKAEGDLNKKIGADDGIIIDNESLDNISENTIINNWDCGIETSGVITNTRIADNTIKNAGLCGIGGWYGSSLQGNTIADNHIEDTLYMFYFYRQWGLLPESFDQLKRLPAEQKIYFSDNRFTGNKFITPQSKKGSVSTVDSSFFSVKPPVNLGNFVGERVPTEADFVTKNNFFANNDFGVVTNTPYFNPPTMAVDGGGNRCKPLGSGFTPFNQPLVCGRGN